MDEPVTIIEAKAVGPWTLAVRFANDAVDERRVDLGHLAGTRLANQLAEVFAVPGLGDFGGGLVWTLPDGGQVGVSAEECLRLAQVASGERMGPEAFKAWMARNGLTERAAAEALELSPRAVAYYKSGGRDIPRKVELACLGYELEQAGKKRGMQATDLLESIAAPPRP